MAFQHVRSMIAGAVEIAAPKDNCSFTLATGVTGVIGKAYYFDGGELKLAVNGRMTTAVICQSTAVAAGTVRGAWITPGLVYRCPMTKKDGDADPTVHATFKVGGTAQINDTGDGVDAASANNGVGEPLTLIQIDTTNDVAYVVFNSCAMAFDTAQGAT